MATPWYFTGTEAKGQVAILDRLRNVKQGYMASYKFFRRTFS